MFFRYMGSMQRERRFCASSFGVRRFWRSSVDCRPVKAYIKRNKHDAADAEAICEAVGRPTMRFVPVKTAEQQATALLHRGREQLANKTG